MRRTRRERLDRATKNAKRQHPTLTWKQARERGLAWCISMWAYEFMPREERTI